MVQIPAAATTECGGPQCNETDRGTCCLDKAPCSSYTCPDQWRAKTFDASNRYCEGSVCGPTNANSAETYLCCNPVIDGSTSERPEASLVEDKHAETSTTVKPVTADVPAELKANRFDELKATIADVFAEVKVDVFGAASAGREELHNTSETKAEDVQSAEQDLQSADHRRATPSKLANLGGMQSASHRTASIGVFLALQLGMLFSGSDETQ